LYRNGKERATYNRRNNTQNNTKHRIHKTENKYTKEENEQKLILKTKSWVIRK